MALEFYVKGLKKSEYISHIWEKTNDELINDYTDCAVELFKAILDEAINFNSASGRNRRINTCCRFYEIFDKIHNFYEYHPDARLIKDRFTIKSYSSVKNKYNYYDIPKNNILEDGIDYDAPSINGLYFVGNTVFNPITHEEFYWVKIGMSSNLRKRMNGYNSCNPMMWRIDYKPEAELEENYYHYKLNQICLARNGHNDEWFLVDRETYFEMCNKGFSYFD